MAQGETMEHEGAYHRLVTTKAWTKPDITKDWPLVRTVPWYNAPSAIAEQDSITHCPRGSALPKTWIIFAGADQQLNRDAVKLLYEHET